MYVAAHDWMQCDAPGDVKLVAYIDKSLTLHWGINVELVVKGQLLVGCLRVLVSLDMEQERRSIGSTEAACNCVCNIPAGAKGDIRKWVRMIWETCSYMH